SRASMPLGSSRHGRRHSRSPRPVPLRRRRDRRGGLLRAAFAPPRPTGASITAAASAGMTVAEVSALARAQPVLAKTILLRVGVELHRPPGQVLALPRLNGRRAVRAAAHTGERHGGDQEKT